MPKSVVPVTMGSPRFTKAEVGIFVVTDAWFPPGTLLPAHTHDRPVVGVGLDGALESRLSSRRLDCQPASLWCEPAGETHSNRVDQAGARVLVIQPDPKASELLAPCRRLLDEVTHMRSGAFQALAGRMLPELTLDDGLSTLALEGLCYELLALAGREERRTRSEPAPGWLMRARDLIHDRFREQVPLNEVADEVGVHPARLARSFRRRFGTSMARYVRNLRIAWACEELARTDVPVGIVALRAGFYDQPHFTRAFKAATGHTPARYRESTRGS